MLCSEALNASLMRAAAAPPPWSGWTTDTTLVESSFINRQRTRHEGERCMRHNPHSIHQMFHPSMRNSIRSCLALTTRRRGNSSIDDALRTALQRVREQVDVADPSARTIAAEDRGGNISSIAGLPGVRTAGPKMVLRFTCTYKWSDAPDDQRTTTKVISRRSYEHGKCMLCPAFLVF